MSNYTNMQYEQKKIFSRRLKVYVWRIYPGWCILTDFGDGHCRGQESVCRQTGDFSEGSRSGDERTQGSLQEADHFGREDVGGQTEDS